MAKAKATIKPPSRLASRNSGNSEMTAAQKDAFAENFGNAALAKPSRPKPVSHYKRITIPFDKETYTALVAAAKKADRAPTLFIKMAIKKAIKQGL